MCVFVLNLFFVVVSLSVVLWLQVANSWWCFVAIKNKIFRHMTSEKLDFQLTAQVNNDPKALTIISLKPEFSKKKSEVSGECAFLCRFVL